MRTRFSPAWVIVLFLLPSFAWAQPMADRIPGDAILYVGWRGTDNMGPGYDGSHMKAMLEAANFTGILDDYLPRLIKRVADQDPKAAQVMEVVSALGSTVIKRPTAIYFGGVDFPADGPPSPKLVLVCDAGNDAPALLKRIEDVLIKLPQDGPIKVKANSVGNFVQVSVGSFDLTAYLKDGEQPAVLPLTKTKTFTDSLAQVQKESVGAVYIDLENLFALVDTAMRATNAPPQAAEKWIKVRDGSGLSGVKRAIFTCGFDGKDWGGQGFIAAPAPRTGLISAIFDMKPLSDELLKTIPQTATMMSAGRFDFARLLGEIRTFAGKLDPRAVEEFDNVMAQAKQATGLDIQQDVLTALGDEWAVYTATNTGGNSIAGVTLVNRLRDPAKAEASLLKLEQLANDAMAKQMRGEKEPRIAFQTTKMGGLTIHYLGVPLVAPSWAIKDGTLYVALFPQVLSAAVEAAGGKSILDNAEFQALRKRLGVDSSQGITFVDLPKTAPEGYGMVLALVRLLTGTSDMFGVQAPMMVPPLNKILPHLSPAGGAGWLDDAGIHFRMVTPFPGAELLGTSGGVGGAVAAAAPLGALVSYRRAARVERPAMEPVIGPGPN